MVWRIDGFRTRAPAYTGTRSCTWIYMTGGRKLKKEGTELAVSASRRAQRAAQTQKRGESEEALSSSVIAALSVLLRNQQCLDYCLLLDYQKDSWNE